MSEPDDLARPPAAEFELPPVIHLPDQSQPEPDPPPARKPGQHTGRMKGRHFGPRPVADPLDARFNVRCRQEFLDRVLASAADAGLSLSAFVCRELGDLPGPRVHRAKPDRDRVLLAQMMAKATPRSRARCMPACVVLDQIPLKLRQPAQNGQQQFAMRHGRVAPRVVKRPKLGTRLLNLVHDVEQISGRPRQTVELLDHDNVGRLKRLKHAAELRTVLGFGTHAGARAYPRFVR